MVCDLRICGCGKVNGRRFADLWLQKAGCGFADLWFAVVIFGLQCPAVIIYMSDIDVGLNNFTGKFADGTKTGNSVISDRDRQSLQDNLNKISAWFARWEIPFNIKKCHILQVGTRNLKYDYEMSGEKLESTHCVKDLGVTITSNLKFSQQCKEAASKANRMLGFIKRNFSFKNKDIILPLYITTQSDHTQSMRCNFGRLTQQRIQQNQKLSSVGLRR